MAWDDIINIPLEVTWGTASIAGGALETGSMFFSSSTIIGFPIIGPMIGKAFSKTAKGISTMIGHGEGSSMWNMIDAFERGKIIAPKFGGPTLNILEDLGENFTNKAFIQKLAKEKILTKHELVKLKKVVNKFNRDVRKKIIKTSSGKALTVGSAEWRSNLSAYITKDKSLTKFANKLLPGVNTFRNLAYFGQAVNVALTTYFVSDMIYSAGKASVQGGWNLFKKIINPVSYDWGGPGKDVASGYGLTGRQRAIQAIQNSQLNARRAIGNEAAYMHQ